MEIIDWLNNSISGEFVLTVLVSMLPVVELRGGIPFGVGMGLSLPLAVTASIIGNMLPVPFLILFTRKVFQWLREKIPALNKSVGRLEERAKKKSDVVKKYGFWGLMIFVAIPLPGTGAWTGALIAAVMNLRLTRSLPSVFIGVLVAALIVSLVTLGVISI